MRLPNALLHALLHTLLSLIRMPASVQPVQGRSRTRFHFVMLGLLAPSAILVACGGGGSDAPPPPPPAPVTRMAVLAGAQETIPVLSLASGTGSITVDPSTRAVSGSASFVGITNPTAAHIHNSALGADGAILFALTIAGNTATVPANTTLSAAQYDDFLAGRLYFNVHSQANPTGELRGQIGVDTHSARLTAGQELVAANTSAATGTGLVVVNPMTRAITGSAIFSGIANVTAAHIHTGAAGVNGGIIIPLTLGTGSATIPANTVLTEPQYADLLAGNLYFNVHSSTFPTGEIRGQIGRIVRVATLSGAAEVPPVATSAVGNAIVAIHPLTRVITGVANYSGLTASAAHIHTGAVGANGGIMTTLTLGTNSASVPAGTTLSEAQFADLITGNQYVNVHSAANPGGELRGQLLP